ncbi:MAG: IS630 family transposase [Janthinobacterium lividum]
MRTLLPRLYAEQGLRLSLRTLRRVARALGYSWKRARRSLRARRDTLLFGFFEHELALLHQAEAAKQVAIYYVDECRVSRQAPVPYAWQLRGQPAVEMPAERGAGGYSLLGFGQPGGPATSAAFTGLVSETAWTGELFAQAVDEFSQTLTGPTVLVLDNASIHRAAAVQQQLTTWRSRGLRLQFLPAYSPELNRIEILWRFLKHYWLTPAAYQTLDTLRERLDYIVKHIGTEYTVTFG